MAEDGNNELPADFAEKVMAKESVECDLPSIAGLKDAIEFQTAIALMAVGTLAERSANDMEIKVGDKVRVSKDAPKLLFTRSICSYPEYVFEVRAIEEELADIYYGAGKIPLAAFVIPTKYLTKVDAEAKEPKFKKGDKVLYLGVQYIVEDMSDVDGWKYLISRGCGGFITCVAERFIDPYTEPTEQTEAEKTDTDNIVDDFANVMEGYRKVFADIADNFDWLRYEADLAKEIALKVANKYSDPKEAADYAVSVAKAVVENLKKK